MHERASVSRSIRLGLSGLVALCCATGCGSRSGIDQQLVGDVAAGGAGPLDAGPVEPRAPSGTGGRESTRPPQKVDAGPPQKVDAGLPPITVACPPATKTAALKGVSLEAIEFEGLPVTRRAWTVTSAPLGSEAQPIPANAAKTTFTPLLAGDYDLTYLIEDTAGRTASCETRVTAIAEDALRIELVWNVDSSTALDLTDLDVHLLDSQAATWNDPTGDCYFKTCLPPGLRWGDPISTDDDARLDRDDTNGRGPENLNIRRPSSGVTYRLGVNYYQTKTAISANARVTVFCYGTNQAAFGPQELQLSQLWKVADISFDQASQTCKVTPLASPSGGPLIVDQPEGSRPSR
jgi:hypothetical protein